jgi:translation initiation factor 2B subunit (eIF-2B alpha/beta/delta family)
VELTVTQAITSIADDSRAGAAQIAERAADILRQRAMIGEAASPDAFRHEILLTGWALIRSKKATGPLVNLVNAVLWKLETSETPAMLRQAVDEATTAFKRQLRQHSLRVAEGALGLVGEGSTVVTIAYSSTVQHALCHAQRAGRRLEVICAETGAGGEGHGTAEVLANCGVAVRLLSDPEAIAAVVRADLVLVGAEMLTSQGVVNRAGTRALAHAAREHGKPFYTLCGSEKFLPPEFERASQYPQTNGGAANGAGASHTPEAAFDLTPLALISGIVTEQGVLPVEGIEAWLAATKLHPALVSLAAEAAP